MSPSPRPAASLAVLLAVLLITTPGLHAQVILNTERYQIREVDAFHLGADLSGSLQRGNTEVLDLSSSGIVGYRHERHWPRVIFGGRFLKDDDRSILDQQYIQLRYSYILTPSLQTFHFVQAQKNETLLLRSRWLLGTGVQRTFLETERTLISAGTGVMGEWERLDPDRVAEDDLTSLDAIRMANVAVVRREFQGGARLVNISYVQPDLGELSDLRILNDLGLTVPITETVRLTSSLEWRRDTRPPSTLARDDVTMRMGIGFDIR